MLSSYFTQNASFGGAVKPDASFASNDDIFTAKLPSWPEDEPYPSPNAEALTDSVMCRLMAAPYQALEAHFNGMLLQIFEGFRSLSDEKTNLQARLGEEVKGRQGFVRTMAAAQKAWREERQEFKDEIKRLELLLAEGKRGLAEVTIARQDSLLRQRQQRQKDDDDDGLETILEFLEKAKKNEDKAWSGQRGRPDENVPGDGITDSVQQPSRSVGLHRRRR